MSLRIRLTFPLSLKNPNTNQTANKIHYVEKLNKENSSCRQRPRPSPVAILRNQSRWEQSCSSVKHHSVLFRPLSGAESSGPPTGAAPALARNVAIIGLLSTSATEPNPGGSLSRPPVVHYGPHSALIRANPVWWAPARSPVSAHILHTGCVRWQGTF